MPLEMVVLSCKTPPHCEYQTVSKPVQCPQKKIYLFIILTWFQWLQIEYAKCIVSVSQTLSVTLH